MKDIIEFKSTDEYFYDEKAGLKNHTERVMDLEDDRFQKLLRAWKDKRYPLIMINLAGYGVVDKATIKKPDKMSSFLRSIQHISIWNNIMSITWKPENE